MKLVIGYLYSDLMNIYGDTGNIIALTQRAKWRGIEVEVKHISIGDILKAGEVDLYFFGGGQDESQVLVAKDLQKKARVLKSEIERGVPLLSICGGYQLLGEFYQPYGLPSKDSKPHQGPKLPGINIFPIFTEASDQRMIGNIVIQTQFGKLVGFENHSGKTYLKKGTPLGLVLKGFGNNGKDQTEGSIYKNAIGCYMHGSLLPKNPILADWLIKKALEVKYNKKITLKKLDDSLESSAHTSAIQKFS